MEAEDRILLGGERVIDDDLEQEAVELGLGEMVGALRFDGVLRGEHEERRLDSVGRAIDGDMPLLHDFEEGRVGLGRRPVDLVGKKNVREHRPRPEAELLRSRIEHRLAGDVRRHEIGSELDPPEGASQRLAEDPHQQRLAEPGNAFDEDMPAGKQGHERLADERLLTDIDLCRLGQETIDRLAHLLKPRVDLRGCRHRGRRHTTTANLVRHRFLASGWSSSFPITICS